MDRSDPRRKKLRKRTLSLGVLALALVSAARAGTFDTPLKKQTVDFGLSSSNPPGGTNFRVRLHCFWYPTLMIKEYDDEGEKGAQWLSILKTASAPAPPCSRSHVAGERVLQPPDWFGYFKGVRGNLVFLDDPDGTNGGLPFSVYDSRTGEKVFEDNAYEARMWNGKLRAPESVFNALRVSQAAEGPTTLVYLRVVEGGCDLHSEGSDCWEKIRRKFGIKSTEMPVCINYEETRGRWWTSAVAYPVETRLFPKPATKTIDGPVLCWPVD